MNKSPGRHRSGSLEQEVMLKSLWLGNWAAGSTERSDTPTDRRWVECIFTGLLAFVDAERIVTRSNLHPLGEALAARMTALLARSPLGGPDKQAANCQHFVPGVKPVFCRRNDG